MADSLMHRIAGEITLSDQPGKTIRKWREELRISQSELATCLRVSPSVISDYESGRRRSPSVRTVRRLVAAMLDIDQTSGRRIGKRFATEYLEAVPSMRDFPVGIRAEAFLRKIEGVVLSPKVSVARDINGYTVIDSIKAITSLDASDYPRIYGSSTERALIFTGVTYGRSPMIAVKAHPLKPAMVVYCQPENVDDLAVKLAELENVILARTDLEPAPMIKRLEGL
jgi:putative transcriptional regulator